MVRPAKVGRSRGCQVCRQRRIKCDLTEPECDRCVESGRACPGPLTGVLFIASEKTVGGKLKGRLVRQQTPPRKPSANSPTALPDQAYSAVVSQAPFIAPIYDKGILTKFLAFFSRNARQSSWTLKLPELKNNPDAHALRSSLRAVSLAYAAHITKDGSIRYEAYRHYGASLQRQRATLMLTPMTSDFAAATNSLLAMVVLSYFELISGIAPLAWIEHTTAAERLMVMLGPESLRNEIIGQLFYSIRGHGVLRAAIYGQYSAFSESEWQEEHTKGLLKTPTQSVSRNYYDLLVEYILRLCRDIYHRGNNPMHIDAGARLRELEKLYNGFLATRKLTTEEVPLFKRTRTPSEDEVVDDTDPTLHSSLQSQFSAMSASYFHAAAIILLTHLPFLGSLGYNTLYNAQAIEAAGAFLSIPNGGNGVAILRMMLPFSVVWSFVDVEPTRWSTRKLFEGWSMREGLSGLVGIGFPPKAVQVFPTQPQTVQ